VYELQNLILPTMDCIHCLCVHLFYLFNFYFSGLVLYVVATWFLCTHTDLYKKTVKVQDLRTCGCRVCMFWYWDNPFICHNCNSRWHKKHNRQYSHPLSNAGLGGGDCGMLGKTTVYKLLIGITWVHEHGHIWPPPIL
jgi:hypothetical protein